MIGKVSLTGGNKCPICGTTFEATPPLKPNVEDREFYGGRVKFFKDVDCKCQAKYRLCIEKKYNSEKCEEELKVINMIVEKVGTTVKEQTRKEFAEIKEEAVAKAVEAIEEAVASGDKIPTLGERREIKKQTVLATIVDKDEKVKTLTAFTTKELQTMCKRRRLKFNKKDNKTKLAETLLAYDPSVVISNPED